MISIKDYAASHGVSYEAVRRQIARYSGREIDGFRISDHIIKVNRTQYLDNEATAFLDARRAQNPVVVQQEQRDETIERLRAEVDLLQKRLIAAQDEYRALLQDKHEIEMREQALIADKQQIDALRAGFEAAEKRAEQAEMERKQAEAEKEEARAEASEQKKRARDAENAAQEAAERADRAEQAVQEAEAKAERMSKAGLFARIFGTW